MESKCYATPFIIDDSFQEIPDSLEIFTSKKHPGFAGLLPLSETKEKNLK